MRRQQHWHTGLRTVVIRGTSVIPYNTFLRRNILMSRIYGLRARVPCLKHVLRPREHSALLLHFSLAVLGNFGLLDGTLTQITRFAYCIYRRMWGIRK